MEYIMMNQTVENTPVEGKDSTFIIRPAGRHILTIGRELIQDPHAAIIELVKNAYDADASEVSIEFKVDLEKDLQTITITDDGHGMTKETVTNKWLVPSTDDKLRRKESPIKKRKMQGRKGIGRYAASLLGNDLLLETTDTIGETTIIYLEWSTFENSIFLDQVEILVDTQLTNTASKTILIINSKYSETEWNNDIYRKLNYELKKLIAPIYLKDKEEDKFQIKLISKTGFLNATQDVFEIIEPFPLLELYDYRITGTVDKDGKAELTYFLQKTSKMKDSETITFNLNEPSGCGNLYFDIRVYDRGPEDIDNLILKGLKNEDNNYIRKNEAKRLLNDLNGIGVYRNGFRVRPLGDAEFDWLELNKLRVQNPSMKIGSDQVIGFVAIESEEESGLIEKTARDGLKDNNAYKQLIQITREVINHLETRRRLFRDHIKKNNNHVKLQEVFDDLFSYTELKKEIHEQLALENVNPKIANKIIESLDKDSEKRQEKIEYIQNQVAIYEAQVTLGQLIQYVLHEGRHILSYLVNGTQNLNNFAEEFTQEQSEPALQGILSESSNIKESSNLFVALFKRLDPLATGRRKKPTELLLEQEIKNAYEVSGHDIEINKNEVRLILMGLENTKLEGYKQDISALFINLFSNSLYWFHKNKSPIKEITIHCNKNESNVIETIDYRDTGPGIESYLIKDQSIFIPGFTTKVSGTGMGIGLTIAGETASRLGFELQAYESDSGAFFRLKSKIDKEETND